MIKFEFELSEEETQVLLELVSSAVVDAKMNATWDDSCWDADQKKWWAGHAVFLATLRAKMAHTKAP